VLGFLLLLLGLFGAGQWYKSRDFRAHFAELHGRLMSADVAFEEETPAHRRYSVRLDNGEGLAVDGAILVPVEVSGRCPALVVLGGLRTGRRTTDYLHDTRGVVLLALDYPYRGKKQDLTAWQFLGSIERMRRAVINTVPAVMLAVDYLLTRADVDGERIVLVGGSIGAIFVPAAAAADPRVAAAAMLFGAGDLQALMRANLDLPGVFAAPLSWWGSVLTSPVEPLKYVSHISPRPVFMLSGTGDSRMPEHCSRRLHDAARDPKSIRWVETGHVNIREAEFHRVVGQELADWLLENELVEPGSLVDPSRP
jgi:dienelactone hydrolase